MLKASCRVYFLCLFKVIFKFTKKKKKPEKKGKNPTKIVYVKIFLSV